MFSSFALSLQNPSHHVHKVSWLPGQSAYTSSVLACSFDMQYTKQLLGKCYMCKCYTCSYSGTVLSCHGFISLLDTSCCQP